MFHWDNGLFLTRAKLGLDVRRGLACGYISHAHADHMGPHQVALATPETAALYRHRRGAGRRVRLLHYGEPERFGGFELTALPAGHCLGSSMLLANDGGKTLLYTGDFKLGPSATAKQAEPPRADILVMESTFGRPRYRLPPREEVVAELAELVRSVLAEGRTPVLHAYELGKAQEVTKLLTDRGLPVLQHPSIFAVSEVYRRCEVGLGDCTEFRADRVPGRVVVTLPRGVRNFRLPGIASPVSIAITGWAIDPATKHRLGVDHALPLSDHADFDELLRLVELVHPEQVYCTHGPASFAGCLQAAGWDARPVSGGYQRRMFVP
ncbi:MAG: MBL fold metallo-hydrolase RNA specificity domain-containing protein [Planctomycetota bacterium]